MTHMTKARRPAPFSLAALLAVILCPSVRAAPPPITVVIGGQAVPLSVTPRLGDDGQVSVPAEVLRLLGASVTPDPTTSTLTITAADGHTLTVLNVPRQGRDCVPLQQAAHALGADADWQPATRTLTLRARLEAVRLSSGALEIVTSYPVAYRLQRLGGPDRLAVDLYGVALDAAPASVPTPGDGETPGANVLRVRSGQVDFNTVRIMLDLQRPGPFRVVSGDRTDHVRVALGPDSVPPRQTAAGEPVPPDGSPSTPPPAVLGAAPGVRITGVSVRRVSDALTQVVVTATGPAPYRTALLRSPDRIAFDLAGADLAPGFTGSLPGSGPLVKAVRAGLLHLGAATFGRVVVDLSRLAGVSVTSQPGDGGATTYLISLQTSPPRPDFSHSGANSLGGKVVVIDPGHGAQDSGAVAPDGSMEKTFTLAVGLKLRAALAQAGATVYMTRADDSFLPVMARPRFAVTHRADFFISVHCDSSGPQNSHSGTTVYFHAHDGVCRRMASDILNRVAEVSGLPAAGVRSDTVRFQTGFGVLRGSPMPAVLVECGYVNSDADLAKLKDDATQGRIAQGIVAGLHDFVADSAAP